MIHLTPFFLSPVSGYMNKQLGFSVPGQGSGWQLLGRTATSATIGGTVTAISGGKFGNGAATAAFMHLVNQEAIKKLQIVKQDSAAETAMKLKFQTHPSALNAIEGLSNIPLGQMMIDKLSGAVNKFSVESTFLKSYVMGSTIYIRRDIDAFTLGHEFQHLGENLFNTKNPFMMVEYAGDDSFHKGIYNYSTEFRAMRIQNQIILERAAIMGINPLLHRNYNDGDKKWDIPFSLLPRDPLP